MHHRYSYSAWNTYCAPHLNACARQLKNDNFLWWCALEIVETVMCSLFRVFNEYGRKEQAEEAVRFMAANGIKVGHVAFRWPGCNDFPDRQHHS